LCGGTLVYAVGAPSGFLHALLATRPLRYLGLISYTFYLYHEAVLLEVGQYIHSSRALIALIAFAITALISGLSWHFFEAPILGRPSRSTAIGLRSTLGTAGAVLSVESGKA
jgi:peptidoglycan/LPS O-acetylase OafA/YrhL